jgi:hypothetical protein
MCSWWWTEEPPETCRASVKINEFKKSCILLPVNCNYIMMHGHMNIKKNCCEALQWPTHVETCHNYYAMFKVKIHVVQKRKKQYVFNWNLHSLCSIQASGSVWDLRSSAMLRQGRLVMNYWRLEAISRFPELKSCSETPVDNYVSTLR